MLGDSTPVRSCTNPVRSCGTMYARRAHYPNMQFQLQEELTAQTSNLLVSSSFLCTFLYPINWTNHCQTLYTRSRTSDLNTKPRITQQNLGNEVSFTFTLLYSTSHFALSTAYHQSFNHINTYHDKGKFPSFILSP